MTVLDDLGQVDRTQIAALVGQQRLLATVVDDESVRHERMCQRLGDVIDQLLTVRLQRGELRRETLPVRTAAVTLKQCQELGLLSLAEEPDL